MNATSKQPEHGTPTITPPFRTIKSAAEVTGLSVHYLRTGIAAGSVPHIRSGNRFFVNVPLLLAKLAEQSTAG